MTWEEVRKILDEKINEPVYIGDLENKLYDNMPAGVASEYQEKMRAYLKKKGLIKEDYGREDARKDSLEAHKIVGGSHATMVLALRYIQRGQLDRAAEVLRDQLSEVHEAMPHLRAGAGDVMRVEENVEVVLDGNRVLLEKGDEIQILEAQRKAPTTAKTRARPDNSKRSLMKEDLDDDLLLGVWMKKLENGVGVRLDTPAAKGQAFVIDEGQAAVLNQAVRKATQLITKVYHRLASDQGVEQKPDVQEA